MSTHNGCVQPGTREAIARGVQETSCRGELGVEVTLLLDGATSEGSAVVEALERCQGRGEGGSKGYQAQEAIHDGRMKV
jgi:hypothetical protein